MRLWMFSIVLTFTFFAFTPNVHAQFGLGGSLLYTFDAKNFGAQVHGQYKVIDLLDGTIGIDGRVDISTVFNGTKDLSEFYINFAPRAEYFFNQFFSIHAEVGFVFALVTQTYNGEKFRDSDTSPTFGFGGHFNVNENITLNLEGRKFLSGSDEFFGSAGFTVWFK